MCFVFGQKRYMIIYYLLYICMYSCFIILGVGGGSGQYKSNLLKGN